MITFVSYIPDCGRLGRRPCSFPGPGRCATCHAPRHAPPPHARHPLCTHMAHMTLHPYSVLRSLVRRITCAFPHGPDHRFLSIRAVYCVVWCVESHVRRITCSHMVLITGIIHPTWLGPITPRLPYIGAGIVVHDKSTVGETTEEHAINGQPRDISDANDVLVESFMPDRWPVKCLYMPISWKWHNAHSGLIDSRIICWKSQPDATAAAASFQWAFISSAAELAHMCHSSLLPSPPLSLPLSSSLSVSFPLPCALSHTDTHTHTHRERERVSARQHIYPRTV
jgi:hypothetical protein